MLDSTHLLFDLLAYALAIITYRVCRVRFPLKHPVLPAGFGLFYLVVASSGAILGSFLLGSLNTWLAGITGTLAKSVLGALLGGIAAIEIMKARYQISGSTGPLLVPGIALGIAVGRLGCFYSGLPDYTYGTPTGLPIGVDFGDGEMRHPVQLYEAASLLVFFVGYLYLLVARRAAVAAWGFYLFCSYYALQRFFWEFLKPYPDLLGGLNVFQLGCLGLLAYAIWQYRRSGRPPTRESYEPA